MFVYLSMIYLCIYSPVCSVSFRLVYSLLPGVSCLSALPCLALMSLKTIILSLLLVCMSLFLPAVCTVTEDQTQTVSGTHSPRFVFRFWKSFILFLCLCFVSRDKRVRWPRTLMPADRGRYRPPAVAIPSPPAGSLVPGLPLPQARRSREITPLARRWLKPAGPPLTQARRPAADSSPPDRRWLMPAGHR